MLRPLFTVYIPQRNDTTVNDSLNGVCVVFMIQ